MMSKIRAFSASFLLCAIALVPFTARAATPVMEAASHRIMEKALATPEPKAAIFLFEQAIVADPANAKAYTELGNLYDTKLKNAGLAMKYYEIALTINPVDVKALAGAAHLDLAKGKKDKAAANLTILKKACPSCGETRALEAALSNSK